MIIYVDDYTRAMTLFLLGYEKILVEWEQKMDWGDKSSCFKVKLDKFYKNNIFL